MTGRTLQDRRGRRGGLLAALGAGMIGCSSPGDDPHALVIATPWPAATRLACDAIQQADGGTRPIVWVPLGNHRWRDACDRRGGIDLILGGPARTMRRLADAGLLEPIEPTDPAPWREVERPAGPVEADRAAGYGRHDPRDDPTALAEAKGLLALEGWAKGYEILARRPVDLIPGSTPARLAPTSVGEVVALVRTGRHPDQARRFLAHWIERGRIRPAAPDAALAARTDDLLADLLGAALVDARNERRDAQMALEAYNHPAIAEASVGEAPPWPPASVAKLRLDPNQAALADSLIEQITPDPAARDWLKESWQGPKRRVDLALLRDLCQAEGGRLAREPRFRAWLRGEWTAWTQQLYRRVARLAGGYRPT